MRSAHVWIAPQPSLGNHTPALKWADPGSSPVAKDPSHSPWHYLLADVTWKIDDLAPCAPALPAAVGELWRYASRRAQLFRATLVKVTDMKIHAPLVILASLTLVFAGCSTQSQTANVPKNNDLGVVDVSGGKQISHTLADGRACIITPTVLPGGDVSLATRVDETNGSTRTLVFQAPADGRAYTFAFDKGTIITVALRK